MLGEVVFDLAEAYLDNGGGYVVKVGLLGTTHIEGR